MQSLYIIIGNFVYLFAQWALTVVALRFGNYYIAGVLGLCTTITNVLYIIASYGLRSYQVSDIKKEYSDQCYILSRIVTIAAAFAVCIVYVCFSLDDLTERSAVLLYMVYKCFEAASDVTYGVFQVNDRFEYVCVSMSVKGILSLIVFTGVLLITKSIEAAIFMMTGVAAVTFVLFDLRWCARYVKPLVYWNRRIWLQMAKLLWVAAPMIVLHIAQPLLMSIPRLFFERNYSTELLGAYTSVSSPTVVITTFVSCAMMPFVPRFANYYFAGERKKLCRLTFGSLFFASGFGAICLIGGKLLGEWALVLLYGEEIREYASVFPLIIIVSTFSALLMCLNAFFIATRKLSMLSAVLILGCLLCGVVTPALVNRYAMEGVTYSLMAAQTFQLMLGIALAGWYIKKIPKVSEDNKLK